MPCQVCISCIEFLSNPESSSSRKAYTDDEKLTVRVLRTLASIGYLYHGGHRPIGPMHSLKLDLDRSRPVITQNQSGAQIAAGNGWRCAVSWETSSLGSVLSFVRHWTLYWGCQHDTEVNSIYAILVSSAIGAACSEQLTASQSKLQHVDLLAGSLDFNM
jgi:hypothetical protein